MEKKISLATLSFLFALQTFSQVPNWQWARSAAGPTGFADVYGWPVAADGMGNVYVAGWCNTDTIIFGNDTLINSGGASIYLVKYDGNGNVLWARRSSGNNVVEARGIATDISGNVYVTGFFGASSITFGSLNLINAGSGTYDMFLVKYDSSGNSLWARRAGGPDNEWGNAVNVDASGNVFVTGGYTSISITFGSFTLINSDQIQVYNETYIVKYNSNGTVLWAKSSGGINGDEWGTAVTTDSYGNSFICGPSYSATIYFGTDSLVNPSGLGQTQMFIAKYSPSGNIKWVRQITFSPNSGGYLYALASDAFGNLITTGSTLSDTAFLGPVILPNVGNFVDLLVAKYDSSGNVIWGKRPAGWGGINLEPMSLTTDASGNSYIAGFFDCDSIVFDSSNTLYIIYYAQSDLFLVKYSPNGNALWSKRVDGVYLPGSYGYAQVGISHDGLGSVFVSGSFISVDSVYFDLDTAYANNCYPNMFLAKLNDTGGCSAYFSLYPDTTTPHNYWALNSASGTPPLNYDWDWGDGSPHDTAAYPSHTYAAAGYYTICLTIADGVSCTNTVCQTNLLQVAQNASAPMTMVQVNVVASIPTGVLESQKSNISIYPNPASEKIILRFGNEAFHLVTLRNTLGETLFETTMEAEQGKIDLRNFPKGIYFVSVKEEKNNLVTKKIVKM